MDNSAKIIGLVQLKGGAGRSTVATNLAGELSKRGPTALLDADMPQGTSQSWLAIRLEEGKAGQLSGDTASNAKELIEKAKALANRNDFIVIDCPPRIAELTRATMMLSDLIIVPVTSSMATLWASTDVKELIDEAEKQSPIEARILWNMYRANTRSSGELRKEGKGLGIKHFTSTLGLRVAFPEAYGKGLTVSETSDRTARQEMNALVNEILKTIKKSRAK